MKNYFTYILSSKNKVLYVGMTDNLSRRIFEHKQSLIDGFTKKYDIHQLVWYEYHAAISEAILRERQIKKWKRAWKIELIEKNNPLWRDLYDDIIG